MELVEQKETEGTEETEKAKEEDKKEDKKGLNPKSWTIVPKRYLEALCPVIGNLNLKLFTLKL